MSLSTILALLVIVGAAPLNWYVALVLWRLSIRASDVSVLRASAVIATALAIIVTVFGLIFVNNELRPPFFDTEETRLITRTAVLALSIIPAAYWLAVYRKTGTLNIQRDKARDAERDPARDAGRDHERDADRDPLRDAVRDPVRDAGRDPGRDQARDAAEDIKNGNGS